MAHDIKQHAASKPRHLVVLVHGLSDTHHAWDRCVAELRRMPDAPDYVFHSSVVNGRFRTHDGFDQCGTRLTDEIRQLLVRHPQLTKLSVFGHSMGGMIARYALGLLFRPEDGTIAGMAPRHFITLATPHLGLTVDEGPAQVPFVDWSGRLPLLGPGLKRALQAAAHAVACSVFRGTGRHFLALDGGPGEAPLLARLAMDEPDRGRYFFSALRAFASRACYGNVGRDHWVGWTNATIRDTPQLPHIPADVVRHGKGVVREDPVEAGFNDLLAQQQQRPPPPPPPASPLAMPPPVPMVVELRRRPTEAAPRTIACQLAPEASSSRQQPAEQRRPANGAASADGPASPHAAATRSAAVPAPPGVAAAAAAAAATAEAGGPRGPPALLATGADGGGGGGDGSGGPCSAEALVQAAHHPPRLPPPPQQQQQQHAQDISASASAAFAAGGGDSRGFATHGSVSPDGTCVAVAGGGVDDAELEAAVERARETPQQVVSFALARLQLLPWRRVDVSFAGAALGTAHNNIQATRWTNLAGRGVLVHLRQHLQAAEELARAAEARAALHGGAESTAAQAAME